MMTDAVRTGSPEEARRRRTVLGLAGIAALYVGALAWITRDCVMDDAYIGFVFLRNLLDGNGFVFHPGAAPVEGVSNIGWLLLGAIGSGAARQIFTVDFADTLMLGPPFLAAAAFTFVYYPLAGMETAAL